MATYEAKRSAFACIFYGFCFLPFTCAQLLNPISVPIIKGELDVHIAPFVQIPDFNNESAEINSIIPNRRNLYVGDQSRIFRVNRRKEVSLWFDVSAALEQVPGSLGISTFDDQTGLRGVAFPPNFRRTGYFYTSQVEVRVPNRTGHHYLPSILPSEQESTLFESVVSEWRYNRTTRTISPSTHREIFRITAWRSAHIIKQMAFRRDRLFIAHGDSSDQDAAFGGGQNPDGLGKIISIRPRRRRDLSSTPAMPYIVPGSNPFRSVRNRPALGDREEMIKEVWAMGFRNPHNLCFSKNGTLFVADIGRSNVEEINIVKKGLNYGWPEREGTFVHFKNRTGGYILEGIGPLPEDDANEDNRVFEYPVAQVGHEARAGSSFVFQAIAGACPVENRSPVSGNYFYADFPRTGRLFYSHLSELFSARTNGDPSQLTQARTREPNIFFDDDGDSSTPPIRVDRMQDIILMDPKVAAAVEPGLEREVRSDLRFGRGTRGELYISSKTNGKVYIMTSSLVGGPGGPVR